MADLTLTQAHHASPERLRAAVEAVAVDADLYGLFARWKGADRLEVTGKGIAALVTLGEAELRAEVTLPFLFRLVKGVIATEVADKLRATVARAEAPEAPPAPPPP